MTREICIEDLPQECIDECSAPGPADETVAAWRKDERVAAVLARLDPRQVRSHLKGYGAWDEEELADDDQNLTRVLWLACGDFREFQVGGSAAGSDVFYLEG